MSQVGSPTWQPWSLHQLVEDLGSGVTSPEAALERTRARIEETEPVVRAWVEPHPTPDLSTAAGPLRGVPIGVKDIIDVGGLPTRCGSALRSDVTPAAADAPIVQAWHRAGAFTVGKTVTTEFAFFAPGPTTNPANPRHTPGGSSSGSAAAVASGQVPLAIGSQTAGSVTRPASYCGVASLVMSRGRFTTDGVVGLSPSLDAHGVYAATPLDLAVAWAALAHERRAPRNDRAPRILLWNATSLSVVSDQMAATLAESAVALTRAAARVDILAEERLVAEVTAAHAIEMAYEAARERAAELHVADLLSEPLARLLRIGAATSDSDYRAAVRVIDRARTVIAGLLGSYDLILGPAAPGPAPEGLEATGDPVMSRAWQALGLPQVAIPGLRDPHGMPLGLQAVGSAHREGDLLAQACWIHAVLGRR